MNTKKSTTQAAVAVLLAAAWLNHFTADTPAAPAHPSPRPVITAAHADVDGWICLDTKFFFPRTSRSFKHNESAHRQLLTDLLRDYEAQ